MAPRTARNVSSVAAQLGQAMIFTMILVILAVAGVIYTMATTGAVAVLILWAVGATVLASRTFRWE